MLYKLVTNRHKLGIFNKKVFGKCMKNLIFRLKTEQPMIFVFTHFILFSEFGHHFYVSQIASTSLGQENRLHLSPDLH